MQVRNIKGFTLLELIAVLVIMAGLAMIAIPIFINKGDETRSIANNMNKAILQAQAESYISEQGISGPRVDIIPDMIENGYVKELPENPYKGELYFDTKNYIVSVDSNGKVKVAISSGDNGVCNKPELTEGMTPIKWVTGVTTTTTEVDGAWYNYEEDLDDGLYATNERWANVQMKDGSMFVWIPRYTYKIDIINKIIDIKYTKGVADDTTGDYIIHPAFTFGGDELTGIWVAKFEASSVEDGVSGLNNGGGDVTTKTVAIRPDVHSWRSIEAEKVFDVCRTMETNEGIYGWKQKLIDTHMMKNSEWGAVVYLTEAIRDGNEIWINPDNTYVTGRGGTGVTTGDLAHASTTDWLSTNGQKTSTTGNEYGVYDLIGGVWEYTAAYIPNGYRYLDLYGRKLLDAESKYVKIYTAHTDDIDTDNDYSVNANPNWVNKDNAQMISNKNFMMWQNIKGDGIFEVLYKTDTNSVAGWDSAEVAWNGNQTSDWYNDYTLGGWYYYPFFQRGGDYIDGSNAGIFAISCFLGTPLNYVGFRPMCLVSIID
ncbi:MAG TPA: hypothetical protein DEP72_07550 [Clostridiales bacterium]|nr:MAG: hypothetical protein A2Y18_07085 [Clostridiales bacterium GWD2_32_19]HCC07990.1 hypothetical protein [Clostridiales bacterium]